MSYIVLTAFVIGVIGALGLRHYYQHTISKQVVVLVQTAGKRLYRRRATPTPDNTLKFRDEFKRLREVHYDANKAVYGRVSVIIGIEIPWVLVDEGALELRDLVGNSKPPTKDMSLEMGDLIDTFPARVLADANRKDRVIQAMKMYAAVTVVGLVVTSAGLGYYLTEVTGGK